MRLISVADAANKLNISRSTFYRLVASGRIALVRISARRVGVPESAVLSIIGEVAA